MAGFHYKENSIRLRPLIARCPIAAWLPALRRPMYSCRRKWKAKNVSEKQQTKHNNLADTTFRLPSSLPCCWRWQWKRDNRRQRETRWEGEENTWMIWLNLSWSAVYHCYWLMCNVSVVIFQNSWRASKINGRFFGTTSSKKMRMN